MAWIVSCVATGIKRLFRIEGQDNRNVLQLENVRLLHELEQRVDQLSILNETGRALASSLRTEELVDIIHQQVSQLMDADNLYVALYDYISDAVSFPLAFKDGQRRQIASRQAGNGLTEYIIQSQRALLFKHPADKRPLYLDPASPAFQEIGVPSCSFLGVPMIASDQSVGVIAVQHFEREEAYAEDELKILMIPLERYGGVPSGTVFVLNDNRDVGGDSRDLGFIPSSYVVGKVLA